MKDAEFIELLNLYLDHEITPADAARLEAEVLGNPPRREIYRDYCRMQKGCKLLAQEFQTEPVPAVEDKVVAFATARAQTRRATFYVASGFAAAAACVAFIFVNGDRTADPAAPAPQNTMAQSISASPTAAPDAVLAAASSRSSERTIGRTVTIPQEQEVQPMLVNALTLAGNSSAGQTSLLSNGEQNAAQFEWIRTMQLAPVQRVSIDEFRFDGRAPAQAGNRPYATPGAQQGAMEWNAIRYSK